MPQRTLSESEFNAIKAHVLDTAPEGLSETDFTRYAGPAMAAAVGEAENSSAPLEGSAISRFAAGAWKNLNPMGLVHAAEDPAGTVKNLIAAHSAQLDKAKAAYDEGHYSEAVGHLTAAAVPVLGPAAANAGERIASGDVAGGLGEGAGLIGTVEAPRGLKLVKKGVNTLATKVAESPGAQGAIGATTGAVTGATAGHPYIGMAIGSKYGGPIVKSVAEGVQAVTGGAAKPSVAAVLSDLDLAKQEVAAGRLPQGVVDAMERAAARKAALAPVSAPAAAAPVPTTAAPAAPVEAPATVPTSTPAAAPVAEPAPASPAPAVPQTAATIANDLNRTALKLKVKLSPAETVTAFKAVKGGMSAEDAIASIKNEAPAAVAKPRLTAAETNAYLKLRLAGKTDAAAQAAIEANRAFSSGVPGTMTPADVAAEIAARTNNRSPVR